MSDLSKALAAVGESAPEMPKLDERLDVGHHGGIGPFDDGFDTRALANAWQNRAAQLNGHVIRLESLALRLAVRLERAERCRECEGQGWYEDTDTEQDGDGNPIPCRVQRQCAACSGTGKEQGR